MADIDLWQFVRRASADEISRTRASFENADPFPHAVIDDFFTEEFFTRLQQEFPQPGPDYDRFCIEDGGQVGTNYANGQPSTFPPAFAQLDALVRHRAFREHVAALTGIEALDYDPMYFGGGIRESRSGTFLPPHLDFNHHPRTKFHRRMNLLFYLNEEWQAQWGGNLQVHRDPQSGGEVVHSYMPSRNRCLVFETSEHSWHGFDRLRLPPGQSRRAFTIYYYTEHRPDEASVQFHNTEYVEPPLPDRLEPGYVLTEEDVNLLREMIARRDGRIRMLYDIRAQLDARIRRYSIFKVRTMGFRMAARLRRALGR